MQTGSFCLSLDCCCATFDNIESRFKTSTYDDRPQTRRAQLSNCPPGTAIHIYIGQLVDAVLRDVPLSPMSARAIRKDFATHFDTTRVAVVASDPTRKIRAAANRSTSGPAKGTPWLNRNKLEPTDIRDAMETIRARATQLGLPAR